MNLSHVAIVVVGTFKVDCNVGLTVQDTQMSWSLPCIKPHEGLVDRPRGATVNPATSGQVIGIKNSNYNAVPKNAADFSGPAKLRPGFARIYHNAAQKEISMRLAILALAMTPSLAFAAGSGSSSAPAPTQTITDCAAGLVFDLATQSCMSPDDSTNDDSARMDDIRSLSHTGRYADALAVLATLTDQSDPMALTYYGFATRKSGDVDAGMAFYQAALAIDPGNLLARSYMGQAHVEAGQMLAASLQLREIMARGGAGTWAETSLSQAIASGRTYSY